MDASAFVDMVATKVPVDDNTHLGEDGLLYCNDCFTARQCRIDVPNVGIRVVPCVCKCKLEQMEQEEEQRKQQELRDKIMKYRSLGFHIDDEEFRNATLETDDGAKPEMTRAVKAFLDNYDEFKANGKGILFYGDVGTGKSFYAGCLVNGVIDMGKPALMTNFPRLINEITGAKWEDKQVYIDNLARYALVAIDDLGVERDSDFVNEHITVVVDTLYRAKVPMIITSNYSPKQLIDDFDIRRKRIYDRLIGRCHPIPVLGESRRKQQGKADYQRTKDLLGV